MPPEGGIASPSTPAGPKSRSVYITVERIIRFKETPGCKDCSGDSKVHTEACRTRFAKLVEEEKAAFKAAPSTPAAEGASSSSKPEPLPAAVEGVPRSEVEPLAEEGRLLDTPPTSGKRLVPCQPSLLELGKSKLPHFGMKEIHAIPAEPIVQASASQILADQPKTEIGRRNRRRRRQAAKEQQPNHRTALYEFCCSENSILQQSCQGHHINNVGLCKERYNLLGHKVIDQLDYQLQNEKDPPHFWAFLPCASGSPWQRMALYRCALPPRRA